MKTLCALLVLLLLLGCEQPPSVALEGPLTVLEDSLGGVPVVRSSGAAPHWSVESLFTLGGKGTDEAGAYFSRVSSAVLDGEGRLLVSDLSIGEVRAFGPGGEHLGLIGRRGEGPGEYLRPSAIGLAGDTVFIVDPGNIRVGIFDEAWEWAGQLEYPPACCFGGAFQTSPHEFWGPSIRRLGEEFESVVVRYGAGGSVDTTAARPMLAFDEVEPDNSIVCESAERIDFYSPDLAPRAARVPGPDGSIVEAAPTGFTLFVLSPTGDTLRIVERITDDIGVSDEEWRVVQDEFKAFLDPLPVGACGIQRLERPTRERLIVGITPDPDGHLWVRHRMNETSRGTFFEVFDRRGALVGSVAVPGMEASLDVPPFVRDGRLVLVSRDDFDVPVVHVFAIDVSG